MSWNGAGWFKVLVALANGKVNLGLEIIGRRPDGYHEIVTILQQIDLADRLTFRSAMALTLTTEAVALSGESNLVLRAAELLRTVADVSTGAEITLEKQIPVAAGLGGGSADAAVTLLALNDLWGLAWSIDDLVPLARQLGTDVAFFLAGGTQLATDRGQITETIPTPDLWVVLTATSESVADKTKLLYGALRAEDFSDGGKTRQIARDLREGRKVDLQLVTSGFQRVTLERFPEVKTVFNAISGVGATPILCGAGPTVMSLHDNVAAANSVASELRLGGLQARVVGTVTGNTWRVN